MKFLKKFENHTQYDTYINGSGAILPNVSICTTETDVHYNPIPPETRVVCKYNVTSTSSPTTLRTSYEQNIFKSMEIDGVMLDELVTEYTFDTIGVHTVKYELYDETKLGNSAPVFNNSHLIECIIPDSVTSIGAFAFNGCVNLTSCTIGSGVTSIGNTAFAGCHNLTSIDIPDSVTSIGNNAFAQCNGLKSCTIGSGVTSIDNQAFYYCYSLTSIVIPSGVTSIGDSTFTYCSGLTSIVIPSGVTSIGDSAFTYCSGLTSCTIGNGVTTIGTYAFGYCSALTSIVIPNSVTSIGERAFYRCSGLTSITSNATTAPTISSDTFQNIKKGGTLRVPIGSSGYDVWMGTGGYYLGYYNWTKVEQ